ncbi:cell division protein SepF [archaeon]|nr:cell division protein SepF [archaeon]
MPSKLKALSMYKKYYSPIKMSIFGKLFRKKETEPQSEELTELPVDEEQLPTANVVIEKLESLSDTDRIIKKVRSGNIAIVRMKELKEQNLDELKHSISKMRTSCSMFNGDIAGVGEEWLIVTPSTAKIRRSETL